ncbi:hypothetical protein [Bacillus cereus]|uniref:hypothetical protein n=1 Tax=Bacillus cereus TaxID=1396 RepID=UPI0034DD0AC0
MQVWLKVTYNLHLNHEQIQRLMSELSIKAVIRKKEAYVILENHLNREFQALKPKIK